MLEGKYTDWFLAQAGTDAPKFTAEDLQHHFIAARLCRHSISTRRITSWPPTTDAVLRCAPFPESFPHMKAAWLFSVPRPLLGAAPCLEALGREVDLHHRERNARCGPAGRGRHGLRHRPRDVPAQLSDATAARDSRGRPRAAATFLEPDGQLRMAGWLQQRFGLYYVDFDTKRDAETQRGLLSGVIARNALA